MFVSLSFINSSFNGYSVILTYFTFREYYHVLFTNLRVMIEAEGIIDEYFGPDGFEYDHLIYVLIIRVIYFSLV